MTGQLADTFDLPRLPRLHRAVEDLEAEGYNVRIARLGDGHGPGFADPDGWITINNWYLRAERAEFCKDRMIVVLYHEAGHIDYFRSLASGASVDQSDSEFSAFSQSLRRCIDRAKTGDAGPLQVAVSYIGSRQASGEERPHYQAALDRLMLDSAWAEAKKMAADGTP